MHGKMDIKKHSVFAECFLMIKTYIFYYPRPLGLYNGGILFVFLLFFAALYLPL